MVLALQRRFLRELMPMRQVIVLLAQVFVAFLLVGAIMPIVFVSVPSVRTSSFGMAIVPGPAMSEGPPMNSVVVRPLDPPLVRTLGLVTRRGRAEPPALRIVCEAIMTLRSGDQVCGQTQRSKRPRTAATAE